LTLWYDGAPFRGWQRQPGLPTVQQALEDALAELLGERVQVHGAARTDAGVHAEGQVASFVVRHVLSPGSLSRLRVPPGLVVSGTAEAQPEFHARSSAAGKRYRYRFAAGSPLAWDLGPRRPDWERARAALDGLRGLPHLAGLASPARGARPAPPLDEWSLVAEPDTAELAVRAPAFRKHEVRNLAGHLAAVALGLATPESLSRLAAGPRPWCGATAPAHGLTLLQVLYPPQLDPFRLEAGAGGPARRPRSGGQSGTLRDPR
jgi:tRNA pseudouridine38-40 synthase